MPKLRLADLKNAVVGAAEAWPASRPATNQPISYIRYERAAKKLLDDVEKSEPITGTELTRHPAPLGLKLMFRTCYIASVIANNESMGTDGLVEVLSHPESFTHLDALQRTTSVVANRVEERIGLLNVDYPQPLDDAQLSAWSVEHGRLQYADLTGLIERTAQDMNQPDRTGQCPLHKAHFDRPMFDAVVRICSRDRNLFERSLDRQEA